MEVYQQTTQLSKDEEWLPEIFQIGLRNPQGMTISPHDGKIFFSQHGPMGGDNLGIVNLQEILVGRILLGVELNTQEEKLEMCHLKIFTIKI